MVLDDLKQRTSTEISVGDFYFTPFNHLHVENLYVEDLHGDTLLYAGKLSAGFDLLKLIDRQLLIKKVTLQDFDIQLKKDHAASDFNFQFLIDAFTSQDTITQDDNRPIAVEIDHICLSNGRFSCDQVGLPVTDSIFNVNHIRLQELSATISLKSIDLEKLNIRIKHLAFKESSGFELRDLKLRLSSGKQQIISKDLKISLPHSVLEIPEASINYTGYDIGQCIDSGVFRIETQATVFPPDVQAFLPSLGNFREMLTWQATAQGKFPAVEIKSLNMSYGKVLSLQADAFAADYKQWDKAPLQATISELTIASDEGEEIFNAFANTFSNSNTMIPGGGMPEIVRNLHQMQLSASLHGTLPQMSVNVNCSSAPGNIQLAGVAGYTAETNRATFDLTLQTDSFNVNQLMSDTIYGNAALTLTSTGEILHGKIAAQADLQVRQFVFNQYNYQQLRANVLYREDSVSLQALFNDTNARITLNGLYDTSAEGKAHIRLQADIDTLLLDQLHLVQGFTSSGLHAAVEANIYGASPDEMEGTLSIQNLSFKNGDHLFDQKQFELLLENLENDSQNNGRREKNIRIQSEIIQATIHGHYAWTTLPVSLMNAFHPYLPSLIPYTANTRGSDDFDIDVTIRQTEALSNALQLPVAVVLPGKIQGSFSDTTHTFDLQADFPQITVNRIPLYRNKLQIQTLFPARQLTGWLQTHYADVDTTAFRLSVAAQSDSVDLKLDYNNKAIDLDGFIAAGATFVSDTLHTQDFPHIFGSIHPSAPHFQHQTFEIKECGFSKIGEIYAIDHFEINHPSSGNILIDGICSANSSDSLTVSFQHLQIRPFLEMLQYNDVKLQAEINGKIIGKRLLATPVFFTNDFSVKDILVEDREIGSAAIRSVWSERLQGARLNITLQQPEDRPPSNISGYILPAKDSINVNVNMQELPLDWLQPFTKDFLFGLRGDANLAFAVTGKLTQPDIAGTMSLQNAVVGINATNVRYRISDSIKIAPHTLDFNRFQIKDFNGNGTTISGKITYNGFKTFDANIKTSMRDFLVLSNPIQTDSMFYGTLKLSGAADITGTEKGLNIKASVREGTSGKVYVRLPEEEAVSNQYGNITYIQPEKEDTLLAEHQTTVYPVVPARTALSLPINLSLSVTVTPNLTLGVIINPASKDAATATGTGNIRFDYKMPSGDMKLTGNYTVEEGKCALSLQNITKREFTLQKGSAVTFKGNLPATTFDVTALYALRADLTSLDESFANDMHLSSTRVNTNCILNISGTFDNMNIAYDVKVPDVDENVKRKISGLMHSDDIKIREVAYLLALGTFFPPEGNNGTAAKTSIWTNLASSTLSGQLNNLLSSALKENWSIGTSFRSNDDNFSDLEMDVNVSTKLFNNRLMLNTNIGYKNSTAQDNNITGDFRAEYKLTKTGELSLKAYNVTNDEYYRQSLTTQGLGVVYRKESKTFRELFSTTARRLFFRKEEKEENDDNPPETNETKKENP
ncbi:MAG: translocation/assembly module TamB domain-containing protein [Dysgonamonadaceae bacterium]|jgi:hypothetical protein|nr:translocation/assembly module TamB domain-containing protein [Dysgonamonadaceae bacterium]